MAFDHKMGSKKMNGFVIPSWAVRLFSILGIILSVLTVIILIICLPDLILILRNCLSKIFPIPAFPMFDSDTFTMDNYVYVIFTIFNCLVTVVLTLIAYYLSKKIGSIQLETQIAHKMLWAYRIEISIKQNFYSIHSAKILKTVPKALDIEYIYDQDVINLFSTNCINKEEREILEECLYSFRSISKGSENTKKIMDDLYLKYFEPNSGIKDPLKGLLEKLEKIRWEGEENV